MVLLEGHQKKIKKDITPHEGGGYPSASYGRPKTNWQLTENAPLVQVLNEIKDILIRIEQRLNER